MVIFLGIHSAPIILGYCLGRWFPKAIGGIARGILLALILYWGCISVLHSSHLFENTYYLNFFYAFALAVGLNKKAKKMNIKFAEMIHFDWVLIILATIVFVFFFNKPIA